MTRREALLALTAVRAAASTPRAQQFPLTSLEGLDILNIKAQAGAYRGTRAVRLLDSRTGTQPNMTNGRAVGKVGGQEGIAILTGSEFEDGIIEAVIAGTPRAGSDVSTARGFVGVAFRVQKDAARFECFYIRPTNGRADDQLRRNHSTQYISSPDFPWEKLRTENPGVYESYCDLEAGAWTRVKIVVSGVEARLFVNDAAQPCLIVKDLKLGKTKGQVGLWIGADTDGWFSNVKVTT